MTSFVRVPLVCVALAFCSSLLQAGDAQNLAVVNVSLVFEKYNRVADVQRRMDEQYKARKNELDSRAQELVKRNQELEQFYQQAKQDERIFDMVQKLRRDQFHYERDLARLNADIQKDFTREMRGVLSDIRVMVRTVAEEGKFTLVLRSPDTDDPEVKSGTPNPADADSQTLLQMKEPKTVVGVIERFNRNPVLYGAQTVDITQPVLNRLNGEYLKRSIGLPPTK